VNVCAALAAGLVDDADGLFELPPHAVSTQAAAIDVRSGVRFVELTDIDLKNPC
jgi:hypothetical protein